MNEQMFDVVTVGSSTVDAFVKTADALTMRKNQTTNVCYPLGAKILAEEIDFYVGGGGTNTSVAFSRLGFKTGYVGKIGVDSNGDHILADLTKEHVTFLGRRGGKSGYSIILDSTKDDRTIFAFKGCNDDLAYKDLPIRRLDTKWLYFSSMLGRSFGMQEKLAQYARKHHIPVAFNPSLYLAKKGAFALRHLLKATTALILNKEEAQALSGQPHENEYVLFDALSKLGPKIIVITDGVHGVHAMHITERVVYSAKPQPIHVVETTGAGDAFASGFVAAIMHEYPMEYAIKLGMLNAESVVQHHGAKNILLGKQAYALARKDRRPVLKRKI